MEPRRIIRTDIAASAVAHLSLVALIVLISEVHPFQLPATDSVAVEIVTQEELKKKEEKAPDPTPSPSPEFRLPDFAVKEKQDNSTTPPTQSSTEKQAAAQQQPAPKPSSQPSPQPSPPRQQDAKAQPQPTPEPQPTPQSQPTSPPQQQAAAPAYRPPEPDATVKYGVRLGLPESLPMPSDAPKDAPKDEIGGARDTTAAKLSGDVIAEFYRHLRSCAKLPPEITRSDKVHIKLRTFMSSDGRLAAEPALIEASASPSKGLAMLHSAKAALQACQPYTMLPADKYQEWRVLDLTFAPKDFGGS